MTVIVGAFVTHWLVGTLLTRSSSLTLDPHNLAFRVLTPEVLGLLIGADLAVTVSGLMMLRASGTGDGG